MDLAGLFLSFSKEPSALDIDLLKEKGMDRQMRVPEETWDLQTQRERAAIESVFIVIYH
jgi:hypothetical protein